MADSFHTSCINHPAVEAVARCKTCLKPICGACREVGPTGVFCSKVCREKHEQFVERAAKLEQMQKPSGLAMVRVRRYMGKLILLAAVVVLAIVVATMVGYRVPLASDWLEHLRKAAGL